MERIEAVRRAAIYYIASSRIFPQELRWIVWRAAGVRVDRSAKIGSGVEVVRPRFLRIGANTNIGTNDYFETTVEVVIEDGVFLAAGVVVGTGTHEIGSHERRAGPYVGKPVRIGAGTWVGLNCTILAGVSIGEGCVIAAGSVVTRDCEPNTLYAGVPAVLKRRLAF